MPSENGICVIQSLSHIWLFATPRTAARQDSLSFPEFTRTHVHGFGDTIQPLHSLLPPSPPALNLSQHQGLFPSGSNSKILQCKRPQIQFLGYEDPLEEGRAIHSSILAWRIPWTEEPGRLQSMGLQRVRHDWERMEWNGPKKNWKNPKQLPFPGLMHDFMFLCARMYTPLMHADCEKNALLALSQLYLQSSRHYLSKISCFLKIFIGVLYRRPISRSLPKFMSMNLAGKWCLVMAGRWCLVMAGRWCLPDISSCNTLFSFCPQSFQQIWDCWTSPMVQSLRICLSTQGPLVRSLVQEDPTCYRATKPMSHKFWACALEPTWHNYWSPHTQSPWSATREAIAMRRLHTTVGVIPTGCNKRKPYLCTA